MFDAVQQRGDDESVKKTLLDSENGKLMAELVSEYLGSVGCEYAKRVFDVESGVEALESRPDRQALGFDLGVSVGTISGGEPLLAAALLGEYGKQNRNSDSASRPSPSGGNTGGKQPRVTTPPGGVSPTGGSFSEAKKAKMSNSAVSDDGSIETDVEIDYDDNSPLGASGTLGGVDTMDTSGLPVGESSDLYVSHDVSGSIDGLEDTVDLVETGQR